MGRNYIENSKLTVTKFNRVSYRPKKRDTEGLGALQEAPQILDFVLPNGGIITMSTHEEILIGRKARPNDPMVSLDLQPYEGRDLGVSRCHAMMAVMHNKLTIQDLNSLNHTLLNGQMLIPMKRYTLRDGDKISLGSFVMEIHFVG